jgi:putative phosphoribosyl transferase
LKIDTMLSLVRLMSSKSSVRSALNRPFIANCPLVRKHLIATKGAAHASYPQETAVLFLDRIDAGQRLSSRLREFANRDDVVVLALPRGGVPVGFELARALHLPLDIFLVRKLGVPGQEELAMGAIASGVRILNPDVLHSSNVSSEQIEQAVTRETAELERRERLYRSDRKEINVADRTVILVDDGLAIGSTMRAAIAALRQKGATKIVSAIPVAAGSTCKLIETEADGVVCLFAPAGFYAVGQYYRDFSQTTDQEVHDLLARSAKWSFRSAALMLL